MPLLVPHKTPIGDFQAWEGPELNTRPANQFGTSITPGNNSFGSAVQVGSNTVIEAWGILIGVNGIATNNTAKDSLTQIGFDFSGGATFPASPTKYDSVILQTSCASSYAARGGVTFYFPLYIPSGTSIMARGSTNNATVGTQNVFWLIFGRPKNPHAIRRGVFIEALGIVTASSRGTTVTPGTTSEGTAVSLGTLEHDCWYWEWGVGNNDSSMGNAGLHTDLIINSTTGPIILENLPHFTTSNEEISKPTSQAYGGVAEVAAGTEIFARQQCSATLDSGYSVSAYAVGG